MKEENMERNIFCIEQNKTKLLKKERKKFKFSK